jgi:t-SNARE complex subunit (syntaxin)
LRRNNNSSSKFTSMYHEFVLVWARTLTRARVSAQELEFQETMIAEREAEIREIETGIHELNDIFRDLGTIVAEQGGLIGEYWDVSLVGNPLRRLVWPARLILADNIESNVTSVAQNTSSAAEELTTAHEYQRKAGRRMACLLLILVIVVIVILLAVSDPREVCAEPS